MIIRFLEVIAALIIKDLSGGPKGDGRLTVYDVFTDFLKFAILLYLIRQASDGVLGPH